MLRSDTKEKRIGERPPGRQELQDIQLVDGRKGLPIYVRNQDVIVPFQISDQDTNLRFHQTSPVIVDCLGSTKAAEVKR